MIIKLIQCLEKNHKCIKKEIQALLLGVYYEPDLGPVTHAFCRLDFHL